VSWSTDRIGGLLLLTFFAGYGLLGQGIELPAVQERAMFNARSMPSALTLIGLVGGLWLVLRRGGSVGVNLANLRWRIAAGFLALMSAYGMAIRPLGFLLSTLLFLTIGFVLLGERRPAVVALMAASITVGFWTLMHHGLGVYLAPWPSVWGS
jgi:putative tricarboxylic transport membrane protein